MYFFGLQAARRTLDFIVDTVSAKHSLGPTLELLKVNGTLAVVCAPDQPMELPAFPLIFGKLTFRSLVDSYVIEYGTVKQVFFSFAFLFVYKTQARDL